MIKNTETEYGSVAKFFHWLMFLLIAALLTAGFIMTGMENSPDKFRIYGLHKSIGAIVLVLALLRLGWRMRNAVPMLPQWMRRSEQFLAHASHAMLYALIIVMPLSGWMMSSAGGFPVSVFGLFTLPDLVAPDKVLAGTLRDLHGLLAYIIIGLVTLHALAALLHHFYYKDNILRRMLPFAAVALCFGSSAWGADMPAYTLVKEKSFVKFIAIQNSAPLAGEFKDFTADIRFDSDMLAKSSITAEVNIGSVSVANGDVQKNITLPEWLSAMAFPKAKFASKKITRTPRTDDYFAEGELTLKGKTMPVTLQFNLQQVDNTAIAKGYITLSRSDFAIGEGQWAKDDVIGNVVRIELRIVATKSK